MATDDERQIDGKKNFPCEKCEKSFLRKEHLARHTKIVHDDGIKVKRLKRFKCGKCEKSFFENRKLKRHYEGVHEGLKKHKCDQCQAKFNLEYSLKRHLKFVHDNTNKKHKCEYCPSLFKRKDSVHLHMKKFHERLLSEKNCLDEKFVKSTDLPVLESIQMNSNSDDSKTNPAQPDQVKENKSNDVEKKNSCEKCRKQFIRKDYLKRHIEVIHNGIKKFKCGKCDKTFSDNYHMKIHIDIVHYGVFNFKCDKCSKQFTRKYYLKKHTEVVHNGIKRFKCEKCKKTFSQISNLKRHVEGSLKRNSHCNERLKKKKYKCEKCETLFNKISNLKRHNRRIHNANKKHRCDHCHKAFSQTFNLKRHVEIVHNRANESTYEQNMIPKVESRKSYQSIPKLEPENTEFDDSKIAEITVAHSEKAPNAKDALTITQTPKSKNIKCDSCSESFNSRFNLRKHKAAVHEGDKKFKCEECLSSFGQKVHLKMHVKRKHFDVFHDSTTFVNSNRNEIEPKGAKNESQENQIDPIGNQIEPKDDQIGPNEEMDHIVRSDSDIKSNEMQYIEKHSNVAADTAIVATSENVKIIKNQVSNTTEFVELAKSKIENKPKENSEALLSNIKSNEQISKESKSKCLECNKSFSSSTKLKDHIKHIHNGEKRHQCDKCEKSFSQKVNLQRHLQGIHDRIRKYNCKLCPATCSQKSNLKQHILKVHNEESKVDKKPNEIVADFPETTENEKIELKNQGSNTTESKENITEQAIDKKYKCRFCKEAFGEKSDVQKHIAVMHFEDIAIVELKSEPLQNENQKANAIEDNSLDQINNEVKVDKSNDKYCGKCQKYFYDSRNLKLHIDTIHLKIKKYKCDECSKSFGRLNNLKCHVEIVHEKLKKFICNLCPRSFGHSGNLKNHIICVHEKSKKFQCDQCSNAYAQRKNLKRHIQKVHTQTNSNSNQF